MIMQLMICMKAVDEDYDCYCIIFVVVEVVMMVEHHVDDTPKFQTDQSKLPFGGSLSVRKPRGSKHSSFLVRMNLFSSNTNLLLSKCFSFPQGTGKRD